MIQHPEFPVAAKGETPTGAGRGSMGARNVIDCASAASDACPEGKPAIGRSAIGRVLSPARELELARQVRLMGNVGSWEGNAQKPLGDIPVAILRRAHEYFSTAVDRNALEPMTRPSDSIHHGKLTRQRDALARVISAAETERARSTWAAREKLGPEATVEWAGVATRCGDLSFAQRRLLDYDDARGIWAGSYPF